MGGGLDIGRVLSRGFQTIGHQFGVFAALAILLAGVPAVVTRALLPVAATPDQLLAVFTTPWYWISLLITMVLSALLQAALVRASILDLRSKPVAFGPVFLESLALLIPVIVMSILMFVGILFGMILLFVPGIILGIMWIVSVPVLVEERRGIFGSMARSAELTKGSRWWIFLLILIYLIVGGTVSTVTGLTSLPGAANIGALIVSLVISAATGMVVAAMIASLYVELRMLKEGGTEDSLVEIFA